MAGAGVTEFSPFDIRQCANVSFSHVSRSMLVSSKVMAPRSRKLRFPPEGGFFGGCPRVVSFLLALAISPWSLIGP